MYNTIYTASFARHFRRFLIYMSTFARELTDTIYIMFVSIYSFVFFIPLILGEIILFILIVFIINFFIVNVLSIPEEFFVFVFENIRPDWFCFGYFQNFVVYAFVFVTVAFFVHIFHPRYRFYCRFQVVKFRFCGSIWSSAGYC
uniref:Uncharacterized protein n=1 Tax=Cacopsylla melanoneura TaxID=428564 RepID=A0A8D9EJA9_9HEMI